jgi:hypothetical protein
VFTDFGYGYEPVARSCALSVSYVLTNGIPLQPTVSAHRGSAVGSHVDTDGAGYSAARYADSNATDDGPEFPIGTGCVVEFASVLGR